MTISPQLFLKTILNKRLPRFLSSNRFPKDLACFLIFSIFTFLPFASVFGEEYSVQRGETALQIAINHNLTIEQLSRLNPGVDLEMMRVGDTLIVPDEDAGSFDAFLDELYGDFIRITDLNCTPAADRSAVCLFHAENLSDLPLFDVQLRAVVRGQNGTARQEESSIPLMQIQPGEKLPAYIGVQGNFDSIAQASVDIQNLSRSEMVQSSFRIPDDDYSRTDQLTPDGIGSTSTIIFDPQSVSTYQGKSINILSAAYGRDGKLIGVRSLYSDFYPRLDITVYSTGEPIETVVIRMEAY